MSSGKQPLTPQQKERILYLHQQGHSINAIAQELAIADARKVGGFIRSAINLGKIQGPPPPLASSSPEAQPMPLPPLVPAASLPPDRAPAAPSSFSPAAAALPPPPVPGAAAVHPTTTPYPAPPPAPDGFSNWREAAGRAGGFTYSSQVVRFQVERKEPLAEAGILGQHLAPFSDHDLGNNYGEGLYRVLRFDPGKNVPYETEVRINASYGRPRYPQRSSESSRPGERPGGYFRPGWRSGASAAAPASYEGEELAERRPQPLYEYPYARHTPASSDTSMAAKAIEEMGKAHDRTIDQLEKSRAQGPDTFITRWFSEQQAAMDRRMADEERRRSEERKSDEDKWQRRLDEREKEAQRRAEEDEKRHQRELDRLQKEAEIRERERKAEQEAREKEREKEFNRILEIEDRRMNALKEESKHRQDTLESELKRNRDEMQKAADKNEKLLKEERERIEKELEKNRESTEEVIGSNEAKLEKEIDRRQESLDREYRLRENAQKKEMELQEKLLEAKKEAVSTQSGNEIFGTINTIIKEFSKGLEKVVDLKKIEATSQLSPEAQAAQVARGAIDGNVLGEPKRHEAPAPQEPKSHDAPPPQSDQPPAGNKNGNGHPAAVPEAKPETQGEAPMEEIIQSNLDRPFAKKVLKEWALHVKKEEDPTTFANMYLEWMRDPMDHEGRKACSVFANIMKVRDWPDMMKIIRPKLDPEVAKIFESKYAEEFYNGFRAMVVEQIRDYWEQFLAQRKAQRAAAAAAGKEPEAEEAPVQEAAKSQ
jgi:hypothetical protein